MTKVIVGMAIALLLVSSGAIGGWMARGQVDEAIDGSAIGWLWQK